LRESRLRLRLDPYLLLAPPSGTTPETVTLRLGHCFGFRRPSRRDLLRVPGRRLGPSCKLDGL